MSATILTTTIGRSHSQLREAQCNDAFEVTRTLATVASCTDSKNWVDLRAQFADEIGLHFGKMKQPQRLRADDFIAWASSAYNCGTTEHLVRFHEVRLDMLNGTRANVTSYWRALYRHETDPASDPASDPTTAHYWCDHELVRTADGWKISHMRMTDLDQNGSAHWMAQLSGAAAIPMYVRA
jgi:hypothetical protein